LADFAPLVTVYSAGPSCQRCTAVKRFLDARKIVYVEFRADLDPAAAHWLKEMGFKEAPVTVVSFGDADQTFIEGFNPDALASIRSTMDSAVSA
jgi:glutaredoxin-like protein NrdH